MLHEAEFKELIYYTEIMDNAELFSALMLIIAEIKARNLEETFQNIFHDADGDLKLLLFELNEIRRKKWGE